MPGPLLPRAFCLSFGILLGGTCPAPAPPHPQQGGTRPRLDAAGDPLPELAVGRLGSVRLRHGDRVTAIAFSPDGARMATAGLDRFVHVWDVSTGKKLHSWRGEANYPAALAFSPDGRQLVANLEGEDIFVWDLEGQRPTRTITAGFAESLAFAPDGTLIVSVEHDGVHVRDAEAGTHRFKVIGGRSAQIDREGRQLLVGDEKGAVAFWDIETGRIARRFATGLKGPAVSLALSDDGKVVAASDGSETVTCGAVDGKTRTRLRAGGQVEFWPNHELIVVDPDGRLLTFDADGTETRWLPGRAHRFALTLNGDRLAVADPPNAVRLWGLRSKKEVTPVPDSGHAVSTIAFTDGHTILTGNARRLTVWDVGRRQIVRAVDGPAFSLATVGAGKGMAVGGFRQVRVWRAMSIGPDGTATSPADRIVSAPEAGEVRRLAITADASSLLFGDAPNRLALAEVSGTKIQPIALAGNPIAIEFAPNKSGAAVLRRDGVVQMWSLPADGPPTEAWHQRVQRAPAGAVAFAPDGHLVAVSSAGQVVLLEALTGRPLLGIQRPFGAGDIQALAFAPDGRLLAAGMGGPAGSVQLSETWTGKELARFEGHAGPVNAVAFSPDGRLLASAGGDSTVLLWEAGFASRAEKRMPSEPARAWEMLDNLDIPEAYRAMADLVAAGPAGVVAVREGLKQAEENQARIRKWIHDLDDYQFRVRENARRQLVAQGLRALSALVEAQNGELTPECQQRLRQVMDGLASHGVFAPSVGLFGEPLRSARAVQVLERIGSEAAVAVLEGLAQRAADGGVRAEARAALARLRH